MKIKYFSWIQETLGKSEEVVEFDNCNIIELLNKLSNKDKKYFDLFSMPEKFCVAVDGVVIHNEKHSVFEVEKNSTVSFFPPISGG